MTPEEVKNLCAINKPDATLEDYRRFFSVFGVNIQKENGDFKSLNEIFTEANSSPKIIQIREAIENNQILGEKEE